MAPVPAIVAKQAELLRKDGNAFFKKDRLGAAIDAYTEAIALCPDVAVYWTNRALCYRKREFVNCKFFIFVIDWVCRICDMVVGIGRDWTKVEEDCRRAIVLDNNSVKAHYMLGLALLEKKDYAGGIKELEKAMDFGRGANPQGYMVEEIWEVLAKAKYTEWQESSRERAQRLQKLKDVCEKALKQHNLLDVSQGEDVSKEAAEDFSEQIESLSEIFKKAVQTDTPSQVPDYLCCKITLDIFRDPVITPSGVTYERAILLEHLQKVGKFDPLTRERLEQHQLTPNLAIKEAVQAFLDEHGWAYKMN